MHLNQILHQSIGQGIPFVTAKEKTNACSRNSISRRRCRNIGVTRNSINFQALIVINKKKIYLGSYETEDEAAQVYDFYSLLLNAEKAVTNFTYYPEKIERMIYHFVENESVFIPQ